MSADKGKSYLPQIKAAYQALNEANANKLICAVRLGDVLNQAAETIKASYGKGAWGPWLEMNCPEISHRTANVYMTLAGIFAACCDYGNQWRPEYPGCNRCGE